MFFRRKGWLRKEYDLKLLQHLDEIRQNWYREKRLLEKCLEPSEEVICQSRLAEVKYFFLLKEAKKRQLSLNK
ncbi:YaaL family protein [Bacillus sp. CGMCC 1.16607]|uniref:YaaL family protein n=1 Tax=Bacillus sp. CGMCC 1.16607 TaxID=3351842 RepID=UPI00362A40C0